MVRRIRLLFFLGIIVLLIGSAVFYFPKILGDTVYPLPSEEVLQIMRNASQEFNVPVTLVVAVARHESGPDFYAEALSPVGATGVMQIMPATGRGLAKQLNIEGYKDVMLRDPQVNIRLGAYYLAQLLKKYNNDLRSTLAHYNAGPRGPDLLGDPGREAKVYRGVEGYARRVIATKGIYEQLYGQNLDQAPVTGTVVSSQKNFFDQVKDVKNLIKVLL